MNAGHLRFSQAAGGTGGGACRLSGGKRACASVSRPGITAVSPKGGARFRVVLWDFGAKGNIGRELVRRGCEVIRVPFDVTADDIAALKPDGVMLSNGPGDPAENAGDDRTAPAPAFEKHPHLRHLPGASAAGPGAWAARTEKLKYGHRGANQPVLDRRTGRVYITSQNHGYAVVPDSLPEGAEMRFVNAQRRNLRGDLATRTCPAFSVQFHPEAGGRSPGY